MKALTIRQPWASLIAEGVKTIETRSWATKHRGPLAIHASKRRPEDWSVGGWWVGGGPALGRGVPSFLWGPLGSGGCDVDGACMGHAPVEHARPLPLSAIVATANLRDCVPIVHVDEPWRGATPYDAEFDRCIVYRDEAVWHKVGDTVAEMHDQFRLGVYLSGRCAWLLDDIKPTTERCPACWGAGEVGCTAHPGPPPANLACFSCWNGEPCPVCDLAGRCDPVPARGRQGLWEWTP